MTNEIIGLIRGRKALAHVGPSARARTNSQLFGDIIIKLLHWLVFMRLEPRRIVKQRFRTGQSRVLQSDLDNYLLHKHKQAIRMCTPATRCLS